MGQRIEKPELVALVAQRTNQDPALVAVITDGLLEEIYAALKRGESVSLRNFGSFYIRESNTGRVFKFNPSQRLRALFGWSSTYHGDL
jgi:DNA-binding protein HU-beta